MRKLLFIIALLLPMALKASVDTTIMIAIKNCRQHLYYPESVERFYKENGYQLVWVAPDTIKTRAPDAMMALDCVRQYGLVHGDYHPEELLYDTLHKLTEIIGKNQRKANFDIMLTDAIIRLLNDLHYGKLNPVYTPGKIDTVLRFNAARELLNAIAAPNFLVAVNGVQPKSKLYFDLQYHLRLLVGLRSGDCYQIPKGLESKMAINLERLRWVSTTNRHLHLTCIVRNGVVINYKDINNSDARLKRALYNKSAKSGIIIKRVPEPKL